MMKYKYLQARGALNEGESQPASRPVQDRAAGQPNVDALLASRLPDALVELIPESVARENRVMPLAMDGDVITLATVKAEDISLADKLRFILNKDIRLVPASPGAIVRAINRHYGNAQAESVDSMLTEFTDTAIDFTETGAPVPPPPPSQHPLPRGGGAMPTWASRRVGGTADLRKDLDKHAARRDRGLDVTPSLGGSGVFYCVVEEGQRVLMRRPDGTMSVIVGPKRVWRGRKKFSRMEHHVAHPAEFLIIRYRDGRQEHLPGPADVWLDPRIHQEITREDALQLAAKEAVVVYSKPEDASTISRRIEYGPALFVPRPGEWLHTFSWHASVGGHKGVEKVPNGLVFQKLWLMPDQMYHDVRDVRTADDAVLTIRLMLFFELVDIERMLDATHDPVGDFVNAATSDVVDFIGRHDFESFKRNTDKLNELEAYKQLTSRAGQCGYRITKVVYRGYGAPESLQQMHDQAIEARTRLQLERATEQQAQDLEDYKLTCQIARAGKRRTEQGAEVEHDLELARRRQESELRQREAQHGMMREQKRLEAEMQLEVRRRQDGEQREHVAALREFGVDLTAYLTQARADRVIELRGGGAATHVHVDQGKADGEGAGK